jgi:predicted lysophospholipase L1 biosynthesis ABC-type transport system permease subunit
MVVRHALGASRARVIAQLVTEGLVLALAAGVLGLVVAQMTVRHAWARASQIMGVVFWRRRPDSEPGMEVLQIPLGCLSC